MAVNATKETFVEELKDDRVVLVDFWATWCPPCKALAPILQQLEEEMGDKVKIVKVDVDQNQELAQEHMVQSIPTMKFFKDGEEQKTMIGLIPKATLAEEIKARA